MSKYTMQSTVSSQPPRQICTHFRLFCSPPPRESRISGYSWRSQLVGRPYGVVAILWRKSLNMCVKIINDENDSRLMGILIKRGDTTYHILNVYLPTESADNLPDFIHYLYKIHTLFQNNDTVYNMAVGDFNANLLKQSIFWFWVDKILPWKWLCIGWSR